VSTTEGDDKPAKYPMLFREAKAVILNKIDLLPYTNFSLENFRLDLFNLNPGIPLFELSCTGSDGIDSWYKWILEQISNHLH
jgi:hydrogenase nickel incorporation protein HypB